MPDVMNALRQLYEVLYVSTLSSSVSVAEVAIIARHARVANEQRDITGLLIFDGQRFCHLVEGPKKTALSLVEKIRMDPRHTDVEVLHHADIAERRFRAFSMGYCVVEEVETLATLHQQGGYTAMATFMKLAATVEL